jgi:hypothetical protein
MTTEQLDDDQVPETDVVVDPDDQVDEPFDGDEDVEPLEPVRELETQLDEV